MVNVLVQKRCDPIDCEHKLADEWSTQNFTIHSYPNRDVTFEFPFNSVFDDKLCSEAVRCVGAIIIVTNEVNENKTKIFIQDNCSTTTFAKQATALHFICIILLFCSFWHDPFLMIFDINNRGDYLI